MPDTKPRTVPALSQEDIQRFWKKVDKTPGFGPQGECWVWRSAFRKGSYGVFDIRGVSIRANRAAYLLHYGEDPIGKFVLHSCDVRACVRKEHLRLGDHAENMRDEVIRGRSASGDRNGNRLHPELTLRGSKHPNAKFTEGQIAEIRLRHFDGENATTLAAEFNASISTICKIVRGHNWAHAGGVVSDTNHYTSGEAHYAAKVTTEQVREIRKDKANGMTYAALGRKYGLSYPPLRGICLRKTWKHVD